MTISLDAIDRCLHRILPGVIATADADGLPNANYVSQILVVSSKQVALSYQFPTKTRENLDVNPHATLEVYDPLTLDAYRLSLKLVRVETSGTTFELLAARIDALSSHLGLGQWFGLKAALVCEVLGIERRAGFIAEDQNESLTAMAAAQDALAELRGLQLVSNRLASAADLDGLFTAALEALEEGFGFTHGMILVPEDDQRLVTIASRGYGDAGIGAEVRIGEGLIGVVAKARRLLRIVGLDTALQYGRDLRNEVSRHSGRDKLVAEVPLPGLPDVHSQMAIPLVLQDRLLGVLALESRGGVLFDRWHEAFLTVLANQIASGMERMSEPDGDEEPPPTASMSMRAAGKRRAFCFYQNDECVFVDDEYLIRNVPAKILWKLLREYQIDGRTEFSNRELRLDASLGLPDFKDNLESRLVLLRKRLEQKCPELKLVPVRRGRFALELACEIELSEKP